MGRRTLTDAEVRAYRAVARAARQLEEAQRQAEAARRREAAKGAKLSMTAADQPDAKREGGRGQ
jgi:hypothetical protein